MTINWNATVTNLEAFAKATPIPLYRTIAQDLQRQIKELGRGYDQHFPPGWTRPSMHIESKEHIAWRRETMPAALRALDKIAALGDGEELTEIGDDLTAARVAILARLEAAKVATEGTPVGRLVASASRRSHELPQEPKFYIAEFYEVKYCVLENTQAALTAGQAEELMAARIAEAEALLSLDRPARRTPQVDEEPEPLLDAVGAP